MEVSRMFRCKKTLKSSLVSRFCSACQLPLFCAFGGIQINANCMCCLSGEQCACYYYYYWKKYNEDARIIDIILLSTLRS